MPDNRLARARKTLPDGYQFPVNGLCVEEGVHCPRCGWVAENSSFCDNDDCPLSEQASRAREADADAKWREFYEPLTPVLWPDGHV